MGELAGAGVYRLHRLYHTRTDPNSSLYYLLSSSFDLDSSSTSIGLDKPNQTRQRKAIRTTRSCEVEADNLGSVRPNGSARG